MVITLHQHHTWAYYMYSFYRSYLDYRLIDQLTNITKEKNNLTNLTPRTTACTKEWNMVMLMVKHIKSKITHDRQYWQPVPMAHCARQFINKRRRKPWDEIDGHLQTRTANILSRTYALVSWCSAHTSEKFSYPRTTDWVMDWSGRKTDINAKSTLGQWMFNTNCD